MLMAHPRFKHDGLVLQKGDAMNADTLGDMDDLVFAWYACDGWTIQTSGTVPRSHSCCSHVHVSRPSGNSGIAHANIDELKKRNAALDKEKAAIQKRLYTAASVDNATGASVTYTKDRHACRQWAGILRALPRPLSGNAENDTFRSYRAGPSCLSSLRWRRCGFDRETCRLRHSISISCQAAPIRCG